MGAWLWSERAGIVEVTLHLKVAVLRSQTPLLNERSKNISLAVIGFMITVNQLYMAQSSVTCFTMNVCDKVAL